MWSPHLTGENYVRSQAFVWSHLSQLPQSEIQLITKQWLWRDKKTVKMTPQRRKKKPKPVFWPEKTSMELYQHFYSIIVCSSCKDLFEVNAEHPFTQL